MPPFLEPARKFVGKYAERGLSLEFWAEPFNALTNASFLIAALLAFDLATRRRATRPETTALLSLAGAIGFGSFLFHTIPNQYTFWLDVGPIALFQVVFFGLMAREVLKLPAWAAGVVVMSVVGSALALLPVKQPWNGSLFYLPPLLAMLTLGFIWAKTTKHEPYLLVGATCCFAFAITARSIDMDVPWKVGTHFVWHLLNGVVVYLGLRAWIVHTSVAAVAVPPTSSAHAGSN